jgi:hypothetical protein
MIKKLKSWLFTLALVGVIVGFMAMQAPYLAEVIKQLKGS